MFTKETIESYFLSYKHLHLFLLLLSGASLIVALAFYFGVKKHFYKGFAIPLFSAAMLFFVLGFSNYKNADRLRKICVYDYDLHPEYLKTRELARIGSLILNANIVFYVSIVLLFAAISMFLYFRKKQNAQHFKCASASLFLMALICAVIFFMVKEKAKVYEQGIVEFTKEIRTNKE
jgi:hypothetical protein